MFEECLYFNTNALARTVSRLWAEAYAGFDLSPPHAFLLRVVLNQPGIPPGELASALGLSRSTVTRFLDALEQRGYLTRRAAGTDGRELEVHPTRKAQALHSELDRTGARMTSLMRDTFGSEKVSRTVHTLRAMRDRLENG